MRFKINNQTGLSLIEVLVAASIFIIGLMAMLSASVAMLSEIRFSKNYLIATGLAREAIEVVKNKRDENYLLGSSVVFDDLDGIVGGQRLTNINQAIIEFDNNSGLNPFNGQFKIVEISDDIDNCIINKTCQLKFFSTKNLYGSGAIPNDNGESVNFYRLLSFTPIKCVSEVVPGEWIGSGSGYLFYADDVIGLKVTATVKWYDNNLQFLEITNKLYDWK